MDKKKKRGRPSNGFDKNAYNKDRSAKVRAGTWRPMQGRNADAWASKEEFLALTEEIKLQSNQGKKVLTLPKPN